MSTKDPMHQGPSGGGSLTPTEPSTAAQQQSDANLGPLLEATGGLRPSLLALLSAANNSTKATGSQDKPAAAEEELAAVATWLDIMSLGIINSTTAGSNFYNKLMVHGLLPGMTAILVGGIGLGLIVMCQAELTSAIPFAGGTYGFVRLTIGRNIAIICGLIECAMYFFGSFGIVCRMALTISWAFHTSRRLEVLWTLLIYIVCVLIHAKGGLVLWRAVRGLALLSMVIQLVYWVLAFCTPMSLLENATLPDGAGSAVFTTGGIDPFLAILPSGVFFYSGIESLALSVEDTHDPRRQTPRGMVWSMGIVVVFGLATSLVVMSATPGLSASLPFFFPVTGVLETLTQDTRSANTIACMLAMPSTLGGVLASFHACARILFAMARAGALPKPLSVVRQGATRNATLATAVLGWVVGTSILVSGKEALAYVGVALVTMCSLFNYNMSLLAYIILRLRYADMARDYVSPCGIAGAVIGLVVIWTATISLFVFVPGAVLGIVLIVVIVGLLWTYYYFYAQQHLVLSPEEVISIDIELCKDVVSSELLDDLKRLLDLEAMGVAVFDSMYQFARKLFAEDTMRFAVEVVRIRHMSLSTSDRPAVIQAIGAVVARHVGEGVEMPVAVPKEVETRIKRLLFKLPRRRVIFVDDLQEAIDALTSPLGGLAVQISSVLNNFTSADSLGASLWTSPAEQGRRRSPGTPTRREGSRGSSSNSNSSSRASFGYRATAAVSAKVAPLPALLEGPAVEGIEEEPDSQPQGGQPQPSNGLEIEIK